MHEIDNLNGGNAYDMTVNSYGIFMAIVDGGQVKLWKNGVVTDVYGSVGVFDRFEDFYVDNNDVYFLVNEEKSVLSSKVKYWKNGVTHYLSSGQNVYSDSIFVFNGDVYVEGLRDGKPVYWVNGKLKTISTEKRNEYVYGMTVFKGDVYCAGIRDGYFKLWKNGNTMNVPKTGVYCTPNDIVVVE
ncbi:hypothetical protein NAT51_13035 [Flavobacterium amniphilum]|uniref:hypothetical protein n=1 Tax=Flavobacterium amniphilum TaxID=1834035 RepID=UPI00202ABC02|nr:hypothetical protein [Flavobacterium amniphilum]MCL9806455.1 hypothetical protein [Flavobacterium amniphilum]